MYNVVFTKENDGFFASVFDQKGNEVYNTEGVDGKDAFEKVKAQNFKINNYITKYDDHKIIMDWCWYTSKVDSCLNLSDYLPLRIYEDEPIANESFHGYGLNRYLHRQFLKLTR